jgi:hypothetical protein
MMALYPVSLRHDAATELTCHVPAHELPILQALYGAENVTRGAAWTATHALDEAQEYARLCRKYGETVVSPLYGPTQPNRLASALKEATKGVSRQKASPQTTLDVELKTQP